MQMYIYMMALVLLRGGDGRADSTVCYTEGWLCGPEEGDGRTEGDFKPKNCACNLPLNIFSLWMVAVVDHN